MGLLQVLVLLLVATAVVSLTIALVSADTGLAEQVVLVAMIGGCLYLAARVPSYLARLETRLHGPDLDAPPGDGGAFEFRLGDTRSDGEVLEVVA